MHHDVSNASMSCDKHCGFQLFARRKHRSVSGGPFRTRSGLHTPLNE